MPKFTGENVQEAIAKGLETLNLTKEEVSIEILQEEKKGFLGIGKKAAEIQMEPLATATETKETEKRVKAETSQPQETTAKTTTSQSDQMANLPLKDLDVEESITQLSLYLTNMTKEMQAPALVRVERENDLVIFHLESKKAGSLIGKHGRILNAIQYLAQVYLHRIAKEHISIMVNVGDYREKRMEVLTHLAERTAEKAKATGEAVFLEPMPAFERKQVHSVLSQDTSVRTYSEGEEPFRYLVVEPV